MKWSVRTGTRLEAAAKQLSGDNEELQTKDYKTYFYGDVRGCVSISAVESAAAVRVCVSKLFVLSS